MRMNESQKLRQSITVVTRNNGTAEECILL